MDKAMPDKRSNCLKNYNNFEWTWSNNDMEISCRHYCMPDRDCSLCHRFCDKETIMLMFCLKGELNLIITEDGRTGEYCLPAHTYGVLYSSCGRRRLKYPSGQQAQILQIQFPYRIFLDILGENEMTAELQNSIKDRGLFNQIKPITPVMHLSINQILDTSLHGAAPIFFFMARIMELINCMLNEKTEENGLPVTSLDMEQMEKAQIILKNNLEDPPSVNDLARRVGVSAAKLKQIFPKVCGMPPYAYLRKLRMEKALDLLNNGKMNVTETAYEVGYSSLSHFARVFAGHFGMKPSKARRLTRIKNLVTTQVHSSRVHGSRLKSDEN